MQGVPKNHTATLGSPCQQRVEKLSLGAMQFYRSGRGCGLLPVCSHSSWYRPGIGLLQWTWRSMVRIIGIDPGLRRCGWGIIESEGNRLRYVACGTLTPPVDIALAERLAVLHSGLRALIEQYRPDEAAVEETFVNAGARSALAARPGPRRGIDDAGLDGAGRRRVRRQPRQEIGGRDRPRRKEPGAVDGQNATAERRLQGRRCGGCVGYRHLPRASSRHRALRISA